MTVFGAAHRVLKAGDTVTISGLEYTLEGNAEPGTLLEMNPETGKLRPIQAPERVDHPDHYGGADNPHEAIKCIEAHGLEFGLGNAVKYVLRAGKKGDAVEDLRKAAWYINHEIEKRTK